MCLYCVIICINIGIFKQLNKQSQHCCLSWYLYITTSSSSMNLPAAKVLLEMAECTRGPWPFSNYQIWLSPSITAHENRYQNHNGTVNSFQYLQGMAEKRGSWTEKKNAWKRTGRLYDSYGDAKNCTYQHI